MSRPCCAEAFCARSPWMRRLGALAVVAALAGCATVQRPDPLEAMNRRIFDFNESVDRALIRPVASAYQDHAPAPLRKMVGNFFANIDDAWSALNAMLQGRGSDAAGNLARVAVNTLFGALGLGDVASGLGLQKHPADLGQTLGRWGVSSGAYLVLPIFGPTTLRDATGLPLQLATPGLLAHSAAAAGALTLVHGLDERASLLALSQLVDEAALDKYSFVRDAYLAQRLSLVCGCDPVTSALDAPDSPPAVASTASGPAGGTP